MALQENLTEESVEKLKACFEKEILPSNPEATFKKIDMRDMKIALEKGKSDSEKIQEISDRLETLENLVKQTFGGHVLIDGQFIKIQV